MVKTITMGLLLLTTIILLSTVNSYTNDYGYYVPHWTYQGWGGPKYWKKLTNNDDGLMSM